MSNEKVVLLGYITGAHGLKGWVKVHSDTDPRDEILQFENWLVGKDRISHRVLQGRSQGKRLVAEIEGITDRDSAEALTGLEIAVNRDSMPGLEEHQYYWDDLVGLSVVTLSGVRLGEIREMMATGANDVMVIRADNDAGGKERLIPFVVGQYVKRVDLEARTLEVDWEFDS